MADFNPRSPRGERLTVDDLLDRLTGISTLAPREGSDLAVSTPTTPSDVFQPSLPARGATIGNRTSGGEAPDFNPRSPRGERHIFQFSWASFFGISTLAPREGSDWMEEYVASFMDQFQPSLPARGATRLYSFCGRRKWISTLAPREGSDPTSIMLF